MTQENSSHSAFPWNQAAKWTASIVLFKLLISLAAILLVQQGGSSPNPCTWDCGYYQDIAQKGYDKLEPGKHQNLAFYPAFPALAGTIAELTGLSFGWAGSLTSLLCYTFLLLIGMRWVWGLGLKNLYFLPLVLWAADRFTFWSHVPYTESLFMLVSLSFLLLLRQNRLRENKWVELLLAPLLAGLLSSVRLVGMSAIASWGWGEFRQFLRSPLKGVWTLVIGLWGFLFFCAYLYFNQGEWSASFQATSAWGRHFDLMGLPKNLWHLLKYFYFPTIVVVGFCVVTLVKPRRGIDLRPNERWFFALLFLLPLLNSLPLSTTRYFSILLPAYITIVHILENKGWHKWKWTHPAKIVFLLFVVSESGWQVYLTMKYYRAEAFNWLN